MQGNTKGYGVDVGILLAGKKMGYLPTNITFKDAPRAERGTKKTEVGL